MYVLSNADTGYSDESMRFATFVEMTEWLDENFTEDQRFIIRYES